MKQENSINLFLTASMIIVISTYNLFFASEIQTFSSGHSRYFLDIFLVSSVHFPEMVHTRWFPGISRQKPWKDANKKRFVTTPGGVLASDHRHGDRITESCFGSPTSSLASLLVFFWRIHPSCAVASVLNLDKSNDRLEEDEGGNKPRYLRRKRNKNCPVVLNDETHDGKGRVLLELQTRAG